MKNIALKQFHTFKTNLQSIRRFVLKVIVGFVFIAGLFFITAYITHQKLSQLTENVAAILNSNIKLNKLKEISIVLNSAEANVKAYNIRRDSTYLLNYENYITKLNAQLDTLLFLSSVDKVIVGKDEIKYNHKFSSQIDTLSILINTRIDLFSEYIALKTENSTDDVLLHVLKKLKITKHIVNNKSVNEEDSAIQKTGNPITMFFSKLFSSDKDHKVKEIKKNKEQSALELPNVSSVFNQNNVIKIISKTQQEEQLKESNLIEKQLDITQREYRLTNQFFHLLNDMEEKELQEQIKRILVVTNEANTKINFISNGLIILVVIFTTMFFYYIYSDFLKAKNFLKINLSKQKTR